MRRRPLRLPVRAQITITTNDSNAVRKKDFTHMKTILVIDDEEGILEILKYEIRDAVGSTFRIETLSSRAKADAYLSEHVPDYIISDIQVYEADMRYIALLGVPTVFYSGRLLDIDPEIKEITICKPAGTKVILDLLFKQAGRVGTSNM